MAPTRRKDLLQSALKPLQPGYISDQARTRNPLVTGQLRWEWESYRNVTDSRWNSLPWLDIRGNHDNFNVLSRSQTGSLSLVEIS